MRICLISFLILSFFLSPAVFCQEKKNSFSESEACIETSSGKVFGTLTVPSQHKPQNVVLIISGSGPTDRDGNSDLLRGKNNCFLLLAHALAEKNIASLRFDKRGVGQSSQTLQREDDITIDTLIEDVKSWIRYLRNDKRFRSIIVAGHSEGSLIGMVAAKNMADQFISISGAGERADKIIARQLTSIPGIKDSAVKQVKTALDSLAMGYRVKKFPLYLMSIFRPSVQPYLISWFHHDPALEIGQLSMPVLILQGDNDIQVSVEDAYALHQGNSKSRLKVIKNMTHTLRCMESHDRNEHLKTYENADQPLAPELINSICSFILNHK